jgi:hypothetical protein
MLLKLRARLSPRALAMVLVAAIGLCAWAEEIAPAPIAEGPAAPATALSENPSTSAPPAEALPPIASSAPSLDKPAGLSEESAAPDGLPAVGLWMLAPSGSPADWLGCPLRGKRLIEPINVIIVDSISSSPEEAERRLLQSCEKSAFPRRQGHSSGYRALIGFRLFGQFPGAGKETYSDALFVFANDHGRIFGPLEWNGAYVFVASFSRESVDVAARVKHRFESFDRARDSFAQRMAERGDYAIEGFAPLGNAILGSDEVTTGDHDGVAVVLCAKLR